MYHECQIFGEYAWAYEIWVHIFIDISCYVGLERTLDQFCVCVFGFLLL